MQLCHKINMLETSVVHRLLQGEGFQDSKPQLQAEPPSKNLCLQQLQPESNLFYKIVTANGLETHSVLDSTFEAAYNLKVRQASDSQKAGQDDLGHEFEQPIDCVCDANELPSIEMLFCVLHKCKKEKLGDFAMQIYVELCNHGLDTLKTVGNYLVAMQVDCEKIAIARQAFDRLSHKNEQSWAYLLQGLIESGHLDDGFELYHRMEDENVPMNSNIFVDVLQACARLKNVERGQEVHAVITLKGFDNDLLVGNTLVGMYSKFGLLLEAHSVFYMLPMQDVVSWTSLIGGYVEHGAGREALLVYDEMQSKGVPPNHITFSWLLKACGSTGAVGRGRESHHEIALKGLQDYPSVANSLIGMYAKCGSLLEAHQTFFGMPVRDHVSWTSLIAGYADHGHGEEALDCYDQMEEQGVSPDAVALACSLKACSSIGAIEKGREIHKALLKKGLGKDVLIGNTLVGMYSKCGALSEAHEVFNELPVRNCVSWTALIAGYAEHGPYEEALICHEKMQIQGVFPNVVTFACVLKACGNNQSLVKGQGIHSEVIRAGLEGDLSISSSLVDMYANCGALVEAREVFDHVTDRDVVLWTALLSGYAEHGHGQEALECFEKMQMEGVLPDGPTFACSLRACSTLGALRKGRELHLVLAERGFQKDLAVGNALIQMYLTCRSFSEAREAFDMLSIRDIRSWTSLMAGYVENGFSQEALRCFEEMQREEGLYADPITLACIVNACGSLGAFRKGREIHALITEEDFNKDLSVGNSLISMYARCGALLEAQDVFHSLPTRDSVSWGSMMKGYCICHKGNLAIHCFEKMQEEGVKPDMVTFTCLLMACCHGGLVSEGLHYFRQMRERYGVTPSVEHHTCIVDLLARSGQLYEAERLLAFLCPLDEAPWAALLAACKTYSDRQLGLRCFQKLLTIIADDSTGYVLMADIYTNTGSQANALCLESLRKHAGAKKRPALALIEVNEKVYEFVRGDSPGKDLSTMLHSLNTCVKQEGHLPNVDKVLKPLSDEDKEFSSCEHSEKLAIAFGLLHTPQGATLRVTKNLKMCNECHDASKIISKIEKREIILRDTCCVHSFKDGLCSCGDLY